MAHATLRDVAALSGVSVRTVSNVVTGAKAVADGTRLRVLAAVDELGYRPNAVARSLRSGRSNILGIAVPELSVPYFAELVGSISNRARELGFVVMVDQTDGEHDREAELLAGDQRPQLFDGLLVSALTLTPEDLHGRDPGLPLVLLGENRSDGSFDHVGINNVAAARQATAHLLSLGRTRIAAIGVQPFAPRGTAELRMLGFRQAHEAAGRTVRPELVVATEHYHRADGARAMASLLDSPTRPDAVFCFSDHLATGALATLHDRGVAVPDVVAVAGFDDSEECRFTRPSLTSVAPDTTRLACEAVDLLVARITGTGPTQPCDVLVGHQLAIRESTVPGSFPPGVGSFPPGVGNCAVGRPGAPGPARHPPSDTTSGPEGSESAAARATA